MNIFDKAISIYFEAKEAIIKKQTWTDEQKTEIQDLVNKYPQKASKVDWNQKELDYNDVKEVLSAESKKDVKKVIRSGFSGLVEGTDYIEWHDVPKNEHNVQIYTPLNHKASATIGRQAKWCTAMENNPSHWKNYTRNKVVFFYIHSTGLDAKLSMIAISVKNGRVSVWDKQDNQSISWDDMKKYFNLSEEWFTKKTNQILQKFKELKSRKVELDKEEILHDDRYWKIIECHNFEKNHSMMPEVFSNEKEFDKYEASEDYLFFYSKDEERYYLIDFDDKIVVNDDDQTESISNVFKDYDYDSGAVGFILDHLEIPENIEISGDLDDFLRDYYPTDKDNIPVDFIKAVCGNESKSTIIDNCYEEILDLLENKFEIDVSDIENEDELEKFLDENVNVKGIIKLLREAIEYAFEHQGGTYVGYDIKENKVYAYLDEYYSFYNLYDLFHGRIPEDFDDINDFDSYFHKVKTFSEIKKEYISEYGTPEEYKSKITDKAYKKAGQLQFPNFGSGKLKKKKETNEGVNVFDKTLILYFEAKEAIIKRQTWTDEQKIEIQDLVNKYPQKASQIDWNKKNLDFEQIKEVLSAESKKDVKKVIRSGFSGLTEGKDYIAWDNIPENKHEVEIYTPLNHKASATIGRQAKWCTAMENNPSHWKSYRKRKVVFFYIYAKNVPENQSKIAISLEKGGHIVVWDKNDNSNLISWKTMEEEFGLTSEWFVKRQSQIEQKFESLKQKFNLVNFKDVRIVFKNQEWVIFKTASEEEFEERFGEIFSDEELSNYSFREYAVININNPEEDSFCADLTYLYFYNIDESITPQEFINGTSTEIESFFVKEIISLIKRYSNFRNQMNELGAELQIGIDEIKITLNLETLLDLFNDDILNRMDYFDYSISFKEIGDLEDIIYESNFDKIYEIMKHEDHRDKVTEIEDVVNDDVYNDDLINELKTNDHFKFLRDEITFAWEDGMRVGTEDEIYKSIKNSLDDSGWKRNSENNYSATISNLTPLCIVTEDGFDKLFKANDNFGLEEPYFQFSLEEPYYGWNGFDDEAFNSSLGDKLDEIISGLSTLDERHEKAGQKKLFDDNGKPTPEAKRKPKARKKKKEINEDSLLSKYLREI